MIKVILGLLLALTSLSSLQASEGSCIGAYYTPERQVRHCHKLKDKRACFKMDCQWLTKSSAQRSDNKASCIAGYYTTYDQSVRCHKATTRTRCYKIGCTWDDY